MDNPNSKPTAPNKRLRDDLSSSDPDSDLDSSERPLHKPIPKPPTEWPRFLVLESTDPDRPLNRLSPFAIAKALQGLAGEPKSLKKLNSGQLLVECDKKSHSDNLLRTTKFVTIPITVTVHRTMNTCRGVVRSRDLDGTDEDEMVECLSSQGVIAARRVHVTRNGTRVATNTYILTFNSPTLPKSIKAGFVNIPVDHFIPNPLRCFKCQRFGHHKDKCRREAICARCGQADHNDSAPCTSPYHCINCNGPHSAFDKTCPKWISEKEVQHIKVVNGLSFPDARKLVESRVPTGPSYANVAKVVEAKKTTRSVEIQTDITWPIDAKQYKVVKNTTVSTKPSSTSLATQTSDQSPLTNEAVSHRNTPQNHTTVKDVVSPGKTSKKDRQKAQSNRQSKGSDDPIKQHNRFGALAPMDTTDVSKAHKQKPEQPPKPTLARLPTNTS